MALEEQRQVIRLFLLARIRAGMLPGRFRLPSKEFALNLPAMPSLTLKPTHKAVVVYYDNLAQFAKLGIKYETDVRSAFQELLEHCARQFDWKLVPEYALKRKGQIGRAHV